MKSDGTLQIFFLGDIALNGGYELLVREGREQSLAAAIERLLEGSDLTIGNLEGPLTNCKSDSPPWRFCLHGNPGYAGVLASAGIGAVSLANNHAMDHGPEGLRETQEVLDAAGIKYFGAGLSLAEARKLLQLTVRGVRVGILAYCDVPTRSPLYAGPDRPGVAPTQRVPLFDDIARAKQNCDVLIVCMHWGQENVDEPAPKHRRLAREMIAAGVTLVVGHHPHVLQGTERVAAGAVAYSLGNFTFSEQEWQGTSQHGETFSMPYRLNDANRRSAVWRVLIDRNKGVIEENLIPVYLGRDLIPVADARSERQAELARSNTALKMRAYGLRWSLRMVRSRFSMIVQQLCAEQTLRDRLLRVRPRHIRELVSVLAREWEQFRGTE